MYYNYISTFRHNQGYAEQSGIKLPHQKYKNSYKCTFKFTDDAGTTTTGAGAGS
jgi:hypothetical protein